MSASMRVPASAPQSASILRLPDHAAMPRESYLTGDTSLKGWLLTRDHKRIGVLYLISISFSS